MTDEEFERLATLYGFAPSRPLRELLEAAVKAEREALVALVYEMDGPDGIVPTDDLLAAIRARSKE
jgi:hypothetical protein